MAYFDYNEDEGLFSQIFGEFFTEEEWDLWAIGEFSLFDNYTKRVGMSEEDANRLRGKSPKKNKSKSNGSASYKDFIKNPIKLTHNQ